jgi:hypothetical protein
MLVPLLAVAALMSPTQEPTTTATPPPCTADIRWSNDTQLNVSRAGSRVLTLFAAVSAPDRYCLPARIVIAASYFDQNDDVVCSGTAELMPPQPGHAQYTNIEIRPGSIYEFVRWRNGPPVTALQWSRLNCLTLDGQSEVQPDELSRARSVRLHATVLPAQNGVATADLRLLLLP